MHMHIWMHIFAKFRFTQGLMDNKYQIINYPGGDRRSKIKSQYEILPNTADYKRKT